MTQAAVQSITYREAQRARHRRTSRRPPPRSRRARPEPGGRRPSAHEIPQSNQRTSQANSHSPQELSKISKRKVRIDADRLGNPTELGNALVESPPCAHTIGGLAIHPHLLSRICTPKKKKNEGLANSMSSKSRESESGLGIQEWERGKDERGGSGGGGSGRRPGG